MSGYADELSVKLTARDEMSAKLQGVRKELKSTEREWAAARKAFAETGTAEAAADVKRLEQRWRELARAQKEAASSLAAAKRDVARLTDEASKSTRRVDRLRGSIVKYQKEIRNTGIVGAAALAYFSKNALQRFSGVEDAASALTATFGDTGQAMIDWAQRTGDALNLSQDEALNALQTYSGYAKTAGLQGAQLAAFSEDLVARSADLASYYGGTTADALEAIGAALRGEAEPARRYQVFVDDAAMKAEFFNLTGQKVTGTLTAQQKVLAAHSLIMRQTQVAMGDVARTSDSTANLLKDSSQQWSDLQSSMGSVVAKGAGPFLQAGSKVMGIVSALPEPVKAVGLGITGLGLAAMIATPRIISMNKALESKGGILGVAKGGWKAAAAVTALTAAYTALQSKADANGNVFTTDHGVDAMSVAESLRDIVQPGWWGTALNGVTAITDALVPHNTWLEDLHSKMDAFDSDLAKMVQSGKADQANSQFQALVRSASEWGGTVDDVRSLLPNYVRELDAVAASSTAAARGQNAAAAAADRMGRAQKGMARAMATAERMIARNDAKRGYREALAAFKKKPSQETADAVSSSILAVQQTFKNPEGVKASRWAKKSIEEFGATVDTAMRGKSQTIRDAMVAPMDDVYDRARKVLGVYRQLQTIKIAGVSLVNKRTDELNRADGGAVFGPGTSTSDSIPAWLSNGEYVIRANAARAIGYSTLDKLNHADRLGLGKLPSAIDAPPIRLPGVPVVRDAPLVGHLTVEAHDQVDVDLALLRLARQQDRDRRTRMAGTKR